MFIIHIFETVIFLCADPVEGNLCDCRIFYHLCVSIGNIETIPPMCGNEPCTYGSFVYRAIEKHDVRVRIAVISTYIFYSTQTCKYVSLIKYMLVLLWRSKPTRYFDILSTIYTSYFISYFRRSIKFIVQYLRYHAGNIMLKNIFAEWYLLTLYVTGRLFNDLLFLLSLEYCICIFIAKKR